MMAEVSLLRWQPHLEAADQAGLSISAYARQHGLSRHTLYMARKALRQRDKAATAPAGRDRFVGVRVSVPPAPSAVSSVEIRVSERVLLRCPQWPDPVWLATLVRTLDQRP